MGLSFPVAPEVRPLPPSLINMTVAARGKPLVSFLWGREADNLRPLLGPLPAEESAHPSPRSADYGFFGSRPFSRAIALLPQQGGQPVGWRLP